MKKNNNPYLSICIPTYEMHGKGGRFLVNNLNLLLRQSYQNFEVVVSDNSKDEKIKKICAIYKRRLNICYVKNLDVTRGMATNINNAIKNSKGKLIKILFLDDFIEDLNYLKTIIKAFDLKNDNWMVTAYEHTKDGKDRIRRCVPYYNEKIHEGKNTIGSPSILTIKNQKPILFDVRLKWYVDCDYYKRCFEKFGAPKVVDGVTVVIRQGDHQVTNNEITKDIARYEYKYLAYKHKIRPQNLQLKDVSLVAVSGINPLGAVEALKYSLDGIDYYDSILISHNRPNNLDDRVTFRQCRDDELASIDPKNKDDYSRFIAYQLCNYIDSDYALVVHKNAHVLRPKMWSNEFLKYDYIGAPWVKGVHFTNDGRNVRVGNGGFSLRSRRLLNILNELKLPFTDNKTGYFNEDGIICVYYRDILEKNGIKFAPPDLAARFSFETKCSESVMTPFGFHDDKTVVPKFFYFRHKLRNFIFRT